MAKNFIKPVIRMSQWGGEGSEIGGGSAGTSPDITAVSFNEWLEMYGDDYNLDDSIDFDDYRTWWIENELSDEVWAAFNPNDPLYP